MDIRTLLAQQGQRDQINSMSALKQQQQQHRENSNGSNSGGIAENETQFASLVDKENFKNAAFSGFGHTFNAENVQVMVVVCARVRACVACMSESTVPNLLSSLTCSFL